MQELHVDLYINNNKNQISLLASLFCTIKGKKGDWGDSAEPYYLKLKGSQYQWFIIMMGLITGLQLKSMQKVVEE